MKQIKTKRFFQAIVGIALMITSSAAFAQVKSADLVILHGKVVTMDQFRPHVEAVAISADTILTVGTDRRISKLVGNHTRVINAKGMLVVPGFIGGHAHVMGLGRSLGELNLLGIHSWAEVLQKVKEAVAKAKPGEWIYGRGWNQGKFDQLPTPNVKGWPTNDALSKISPDNPVVLSHSSGHALIANKKALELSGVTKKTPNPEGGTIIRNKKGRPIGVMTDAAEGLVGKKQAHRSANEIYEDRLATFNRAAKDAISKGLTSLKDDGESLSMLDFYKRLDHEGKLPLRIYAMIGEHSKTLAKALPEYRIIGHGNWFLTVRTIGENVIDGALGTRTAHFIKPYSDDPGNTGTQVTSVAEETKEAELAIKYGMQMSIHAIGDLANRQLLDIYQKVHLEHPDKTDLRWEIEHAQHLNPNDIPRFAQLGITASMQSNHECSDAHFVIKRIGKKRAREGAYVWHKLIENGTVVTDGTDVPVHDEDPIPNFKCGVTRQLDNGLYFYPNEAKTRMQELKSYTLNNAYSMFQEDHLGSITPGKLADIAILSRDIMTVPADSIDSAKVVYTIIGGKVKYDHGKFENMK